MNLEEINEELSKLDEFNANLTPAERNAKSKRKEGNKLTPKQRKKFVRLKRMKKELEGKKKKDDYEFEQGGQPTPVTGTS